MLEILKSPVPAQIPSLVTATDLACNTVTIPGPCMNGSPTPIVESKPCGTTRQWFVSTLRSFRQEFVCLKRTFLVDSRLNLVSVPSRWWEEEIEEVQGHLAE